MNDIKPIKFCGVDSKRPVVIAGPCSAETEEQVMETAKDLAKNGVRIFRAGIWKPRTKPGGFEGVGSVGLTWLQEVKKETGMLVATEVANKQHVEEALNAGVDVLWIGARTSANPFAMQEILFDPQTSGGLLLAVASKEAESLRDELQKASLPAQIVGEITEKQDTEIVVSYSE